MFPTCAFCNGRFDGDGGPTGLGVGRRFAFDEWRGRLWVICPRCARWNLTPFDDRLERIETLARLATRARLVANTDEVALLRWERYDLVRIGRPPRVELATWRYGERLRQRARERARIVVPVAVAALGVAVAIDLAAGGSLSIIVYNAGNIGEFVYTRIVGGRRVAFAEPLTCAACGTLIDLRAKHVPHARLLRERREDVALLVSCPRCRAEATLVTGDDAIRAMRQGLAFLNARRSGRRRATEAARELDRAGGADALVTSVARGEPVLRSLTGERRLALEMAVDEQVELRELARQWREAEEIAAIADGTLSGTGSLEQQLEALARRTKSTE